jgi:hypothetical protein
MDKPAHFPLVPSFERAPGVFAAEDVVVPVGRPETMVASGGHNGRVGAVLSWGAMVMLMGPRSVVHSL